MGFWVGLEMNEIKVYGLFFIGWYGGGRWGFFYGIREFGDWSGWVDFWCYFICCCDFFDISIGVYGWIYFDCGWLSCLLLYVG